ncbi:Uncharacterised protein [uncultured archaeon]|nr:Uncharacterised protein [uncultured archaeon]
MFELFFREIRRKSFHLTGSLIPIVYYFLSKETAVLGLSVINLILFLMEWLRLKGKITLPEMLLRPHENKQVAAYIYFQMAALFSIILFDKTVAIAAILMLAIGDTVSGLAGSLIKGGNVRSKDKRFAIKPFPIMAAMFLACVAIGLIFLSLPLAQDMIHLSYYVYIAGALGATLGDAVAVRIKGRVVDDNLMIPLVAGVFMTATGFG